MSKRAYNFNAGPAALPYEVLQQAQAELLEYNGIGMSIMEISHRSSQYEQLNDETQKLLLQLLGVSSGYKVLFLQGGASTQFAMVPMNFIGAEQSATYLVNGSWGKKAYDEAKQLGKEVNMVKGIEELAQLPNHTSYVHVTSNETIAGSQMHQFPNTGDIPLIADMSSDMMCRPVDVSQFAMIYAGAQKNLGPSGVTIVIVREDLLESVNSNIPTMLSYSTHADNNSLYNTPPVYSIYMVNLVLKWIESFGGLKAMEERNRDKAKVIYDQIDTSGGFYYGPVNKADRSLMNITFRLKDEQLESVFVKEATEAGFVGLKGHRSVGGLRASAYNAVPRESCEALGDFMQQFRLRNS